MISTQVSYSRYCSYERQQYQGRVSSSFGLITL